MTSAVKTIQSTASVDKSVVILNKHISAVSSRRNLDLEKNLQMKVKMAGKKWVEFDLFEDDFIEKYEKLRRQAEAALSRLGGRCELGYVYRKKTAIETVKKLRALAKSWEDYKIADEPVYSAMCQAVADRTKQQAINAGASTEQVERLYLAICENQPDWEYMDRQMQFNFSLIQQPLDVDDFDPELYEEQANGLTRIRDSVMGNLIKEVAKMASDIEKNMRKNEVNADRTKPLTVGVRTINRAWDMVEKLDELDFIHPHIGVVARELRDNLSAFPRDQKLIQQYQNFKAIISSLSDQVELVAKLDAQLPLISIVCETSETQTESNIQLEEKSEPTVIDVISPDSGDESVLPEGVNHVPGANDRSQAVFLF